MDLGILTAGIFAESMDDISDCSYWLCLSCETNDFSQGNLAQNKCRGPHSLREPLCDVHALLWFDTGRRRSHLGCEAMLYLISLSPIALAAMGITLTLACRHSCHPWIIHLIFVPLMVIAAPATVMFIAPAVPCPDEVCSTPQMIQSGPIDPGVALLLYVACLIPTMILYCVFGWRFRRSAELTGDT